VVAVGAYRLKEAQVAPTLNGLSTAVSDWKNRASTTEAREKSTAQLLKQSESERERLRKSLADAQAKYAELQNQQKSLEAELAAEHARVDQESQEAETARNGVEEKNKEVAQLEARVQNAVQRTEGQRRIA
jgi:chromosome segregation ATPase